MATEFRRMQQLRGNEGQWASNDQVILAGELAIQTGPGTGEARAKIGDGSSAFSELPWVFEVDQTARDAIAATDGVVVTLDSRVTALEDAMSGGGSIADLAAQVAGNTADILLKQDILPVGANAGDVSYWNGTAFVTTALSPAASLGTMLYWDNVSGAYLGVAPGSPGQALVLSVGGIPSWTTNPAAGVPEAPNDGLAYQRASLAWVAAPPPISVSVATVAGATHTLVAGNAGQHILFTSTTGCVVTVPANATVPFPIGTRIEMEARDATDPVSVVAAGAAVVTFRTFFDPETAGQYAVIRLTKTAIDAWSLDGDLVAA